MTKYTVAVNHCEYCDGLFDTYQLAYYYAVNLIKQDFEEVSDWSDDEAYDYSDGYYSVVKIVI
ncbi:hypothetical protein [Enterococcus sp.]|uniref:hypothetical protein n=1 Tax=Enterococcus sp. TaxID=35783 RepID=UPI002FC788DA